MSRLKRELKKKFVVFCEGDTEFHYIDHMRKWQGVEISLQPINMKGGGYTNFLNEIRTKAQTNCIAKFVIVDADRISSNSGEEKAFRSLLDYCRLQIQKRAVPHFLIVNNPDFEYVSCLHIAEYKGQNTNAFITRQLGFKSIEQFKAKEDIYSFLNSGNNGYPVMLEKIRGSLKLVKNIYVIRKKSFDIEIKETILDMGALINRGSNLEEFFDVIDW